MPSIYSGSTQIESIYHGSTEVQRVYVGDTRVWTASHVITQGVYDPAGDDGYGEDSDSYYGYSNDQFLTFGSITRPQLNGVTIDRVVAERYSFRIGSNNYLTTEETFEVVLDGNRAQNFFTSLTESSIGTLLTGNASHSYNSSYDQTTWTWTLSGLGNWDGSGELEVEFT